MVMQAIPNDEHTKQQLRAYGQAATSIGLSLLFVAQTVHGSSLGIVLSVASAVLSVSGLALLFKGANRERRLNIVAMGLAALVAGAVFAVMMLRR